ncbi:MAG TPA: 1-acyl-sn-glycerol-3-phosphate acyltransferase [Thermopetrobacter sp.]|nr:1-acyl-sn-glycerol-3-phosphate acyltransferase [Thermopetrobacter sp.]
MKAGTEREKDAGAIDAAGTAGEAAVAGAAARPRLTAGVVARSLALNLAFYTLYPLAMIGGFFFLFTPRRTAMAALKWWSGVFRGLCRHLAGIEFEVRGREHIPAGRPLLVAGKHQSMWETFALYDLFDDPAIVLKRELTWIPLVGWFIRKFAMIPVEREKGPAALRALVRHARAAVEEGRQIIIFPEGTRRPVDAPPEYRPGVAALYAALRIPCLPFALNSGLFWPRRRFWRWPGTIVVEFLPPIEPGLARRVFMRRLEESIEPAARRLAAEGRRQLATRGYLPPRASSAS